MKIESLYTLLYARKRNQHQLDRNYLKHITHPWNCMIDAALTPCSSIKGVYQSAINQISDKYHNSDCFLLIRAYGDKMIIDKAQ